ncbi:thiaminase II [Sulfurimonas aquatica]|uniref:Aminopyrimidine aminohydrolase n=1 Tax=Sulfurimonas aquatica TaxID=2672570 RepID=A0A975GBF1_9BACT|nr:thiaminase II [Sulfurimonas aquatica]QSZ40581.1 thiaminase II [Sulfurimonas aquatica]
MQNWYEKTRAKTEYIYQEIIMHDFVSELMQATLDKDTFGFYVNQDSLYLSEYKKALVGVGSKCHRAEDTQFFYESATGIIQVEDALHKEFLEEQYKNTTPSPTCELYNSYLARIVNNESVEIGAAAVLPCFTIYKEVGDFILANQENRDSNPYQAWIATYASDEFAQAVKQAINIVDTYALTASPESLAKMEEVFIKTSKLEWMFWDSAYKQEQWKI